MTELWVRILRFEASDPHLISEMKKDAASGGLMYCLRRNALGYGLYEVNVEPSDGPLIHLPHHLAMELRNDANRASVEKGEDVSLTWKLLGAAESMGRWVSFLGPGDEEGGVNEDLKAQARRRPEDVFEVKQREQLKKAAVSVKVPIEKILGKVVQGQDPFLSLPKEVARQLLRLRTKLSASIAATFHVMPEEIVEGHGELREFVEICTLLERTGGWPQMEPELKQEVLNFSNKYSRDLEDHARNLGRSLLDVQRVASSPAAPAAIASASTSAVDEGLLASLVQPSPSRGSTSGVFFLPPPPKSSSGGVGSLI